MRKNNNYDEWAEENPHFHLRRKNRDKSWENFQNMWERDYQLRVERFQKAKPYIVSYALKQGQKIKVYSNKVYLYDDFKFWRRFAKRHHLQTLFFGDELLIGAFK